MIGIVGLGYVGVTSLLGFHRLGVEVIGYDTDASVKDSLLAATLPITDLSAADYLKQCAHSLRLADSIFELSACDDVLICVPTNETPSGLDLSIVKTVVGQLNAIGVKRLWIRSTLDDPCLVEALGPVTCEVGVYPEFLREGNCWQDFFDPAFVILGHDAETAPSFANVLKRHFPAVKTCNVAEAITVKLASNAFHAMKIAFANELRQIEWYQQIDLANVMDIFSSDRKLNISSAYLKPGLPFGGPCLDKDTAALAKRIKANPARNLFSAVIDQNKGYLDAYVHLLCGMPCESIGFDGFEFKRGSGDTRNSPILKIARAVSKKKKVVICDHDHIDAKRNQWELEGLQIISDRNELYGLCDKVISVTDRGEDSTIMWSELWDLSLEN